MCLSDWLQLIERVSEKWQKNYIEDCMIAQPKQSWTRQYGRAITPYTENCLIYKQWVIGGITGCGWSDKDQGYPRDPDPEPNNDLLDAILTEVAPDIKYLQYRKIEALEKQSYYEEQSGYYGNRNRYAVKTIALKDLYAALVDMGYLQ